MSTRALRSGSERPQEETEELPLSRRQLDSSASFSMVDFQQVAAISVMSVAKEVYKKHVLKS